MPPPTLSSLPDELISLTLHTCDLQALRRARAVSHRLCRLARRAVADDGWNAVGAHRDELRVAMWVESSYTVRELDYLHEQAPPPRAIRAMSFCHDTSLLACVGGASHSRRAGVLHLWRLHGANSVDEHLYSLPLPMPATSVALSNDGWCTAGACGAAVVVWAIGHSVRSGVNMLGEGHRLSVTGLAWAGGRGERLVSCAMDGSLRVWATSSGSDWFAGAELSSAAVMRLPAALHAGAIYAVAAAGRDAVCSGGSDRAVSLWSLSRGSCVQQLVGHRGPVQAVASCDELGLLASASLPRGLRLWDARSGACVARLHGCLLPSSVDDATCSLACAGPVLASTCSEGVKLWDLRHARRELAELSDESDQVCAIAMGGGRLCAGSDVGEVRVWEQLGVR